MKKEEILKSFINLSLWFTTQETAHDYPLGQPIYLSGSGQLYN